MAKCPQLRDKYGYPMHTSQVKEALGLSPVHKWGKEEKWVKTAPDGTMMFLLTAEDAAKHAKHGNRPHRLFAMCECCKKTVPAGRLHQHYKSHK